MIKNLPAFVVLLSALLVRAQPYGNEWVDYNAVYYKIQVSADGFYRIPQTTLASYIPSINNVPASEWALYYRGQQVPIYVSYSGSNFTVNDYIEFYGVANRGDIDSLLYPSASMQSNPYYSLFTDVSTYYLTRKAGGSNLRFVNTPNNINNPPPKENYYMHRVIDVKSGTFFPGRSYLAGGKEVFKSTFEEGEGYVNSTYFGTQSGSGQVVSQDVTLNCSAVYPPGPNATLRVSFINRATGPGELRDVRLAFNGTNLPYNNPTNQYRINLETFTISPSQIINGNNIVNFKDAGTGISLRQNTVCFVELTYPRQFNFNNANTFYFQLGASLASRYLEITNFNDNGLKPVLYDLTNGYRLQSNDPPGTSPLRFLLPPSTIVRELAILSGGQGSYTTVTSVTPYVFDNLASLSRQGDYIIISHSKLMTPLQGINYVEEYRKFRDVVANPATGKYTARVINIDTLYDQFAYGIQKSPLAIRNFIRWARDNWQIKPRFVFLIGKGREMDKVRNPNSADYAQCLIPSFGYPASDNLLAASRESDTMMIQIGRLAAETPQQVKDYLQKVKDYEEQLNFYPTCDNINAKDWQKQIMHLGGGTTLTEQNLFKFYLSEYEKIAEDTSWGANVHTFTKQGSQPLSQSVSDIINNRIKEGVSIINFFGHSGNNVFDFSTDIPQNYQNYKKYPLFISNGCYAGNIHDKFQSSSEQFVFEPNKAAIAFLSTTSLSVSSGLHAFVTAYYLAFSRSMYRKTMGESLVRAFNNVLTKPSSTHFDKMVAFEMTFHGDPALPFNQHPKPDYAIQPSYINIVPATVTPNYDSFEVRLTVINLGKAIRDSIVILLTRTITDASNTPSVYQHFFKVKAPYYLDTFSLRLPTLINNIGYGQNTIQIQLDATNTFDEMDECNNQLVSPISFNIQGDDVVPIYPYEFAIVPKQGVTLKASTVNPFAPLRTYRFEIDTSELFLQPLQSGTVTQTGGVLHFTPTIVYADSTVYYWRVAIDSTNPQWRYSSFIYLKDEYPGWNQSHLYQWQKDFPLNLNIDASDRRFKFPPTVNTIRVTAGYTNAVGGNIDAGDLGWEYNNYSMHSYRMGGCGFNNGLTFAVIDSVTGEAWGSFNTNPYDNFGDKFGNYHCSDKTNTQFGFDFRTVGVHPTTNTNLPYYGKTWGQVIQRFIDSIPNGHYILVYSNNIVPYTSWDSTVIQALSSIGFPALFLKSGNGTGNCVYFTQKGKGSGSFSYSNNFWSPLDTTITFTGNWFSGTFTSTLIGPALEWGSLHWRRTPVELPDNDSTHLEVIGVNAAGAETLLFTTSQPDHIFDTNIVKASVYPYLKLRWRATDLVHRTPPQMQYWRVLYKKAPEAAVNPAAHFVISNNLAAGGTLHMEMALESITEADMDSMLVKYTLRDAQLNNITSYIRHSPLPGLDTLIMEYNAPLNSTSYVGVNKLSLEANPDNDQPEQFHFNNFAEISFQVSGDETNPLLDVTFDGQHIFNGDIVSAKPHILITLRDENKFLALNDTSVIDVYIRYPNETELRRIGYASGELTFYPADVNLLHKENRARVSYSPHFAVDGRYELVVRAADRSGNHPTVNARLEGFTYYDYKISFEVINKMTITHVLNYPNPFSTATQFIFTLTGSEVPDFMKIQIMNVKGTVVKEIYKDELGPLRIGVNRTEYKWDGRDQYGDLLANGVYFYRVVAKNDGEKVEHNPENYDKYFKKGFGKMVILR
ncbi:MAG: C25 family cysteine peptidase [Chitinophagales bacterium]|nr:C25 family cysteine peptidase [Chitinophagales bacterium]MDW8419695.1 C25 family cysteine peptidase [Chitinophagales bacterium]